MNNGVIIAVVTVLGGIVTVLITAWVKRIEGKDKIFQQSIRKDMKVMYALKEDYGQLHTWALGARTQHHLLQIELQANGAIRRVTDLPPIPAPTWEKVEDQVA